MSEYSITINVQEKSNNGQPNATGSSDNQTTEAEQLAQGSDESVKGMLKQAVAATGVVAMGTRTLNYITTRVYPETGNRQMQDNINAAKQVGGQILGIITAFAAGGIPGGIAAIGAVGLDYAMQLSTYGYNKSMESVILGIQRERMGIANMALSRSRALNQ